jgi:hypothetical protein
MSGRKNFLEEGRGNLLAGQVAGGVRRKRSGGNGRYALLLRLLRRPRLFQQNPGYESD